MANSERLFNQIYDEFQPKIQRYLARLVGEVEAQDLTQEVWGKISQSFSSFRGDSRLSTWIYRVATNTALDRLRQTASQRGLDTGLSDGDCIDGHEEKNWWTGEEKAPLDQQIIRQEMNGCIREIIDTLPDDYRTVIVLSELEGFTDQEISEVLSITRQTVKIRLHRGRASLRKELSAACVFFRDERNEFACDRKNLQVRIEKT